MNDQDELKLLRMEVEFLRHSRDQWKMIAASYEEVAKKYKTFLEIERTRGAATKERAI